ncbi:MAG TPA: hypothetical protein VGF94_29290 [Kofleriaceae bacterium]|jgi:hypothetical protein
MRALAAISLVMLAGCFGERPAMFSAGTSWTFPLVDPLADTELIVPVYVGHRGPFLFALDPARPSRIDRVVVAESGGGPDLTIRDVRIGDLAVSALFCRTIAPHALDAAGRRVVGTIGREVFGDDVVFGFDRARGIAWVSTRSAFHRPDQARVVAFEPWQRVRVDIDGKTRDMVVDLGAVANSLQPALWPGGTSWTAREVHVADFEQPDVAFEPSVVPVRASRSDGTLGLGFFRLVNVSIDAGKKRMYLVPRTSERDVRGERLARWGAAIASCKSAGCAQLELVGRMLHVKPETPERAVELVVRARGRDGVLPDLEINLARGVAPFEVKLDERYADAELEVIDASPFPRTCVDGPACVVAMDAGR